MIVTTLAAPAAEPVGLAEAKDYLRVSGDGEDGLVGHLIAAARSRIEEAAGVAMITRSLRASLDWWPRGTVERRWLRLPVRPAGELIAVRVFDAHGEAVTVTSRFTLPAGRQAKLMWTDGAFPWPGQRIGGIEIDYEAGFGEGPEDVADSLRLAVKRLAAHAYAARDPSSIADALPMDVAGLIAPWRRVRL
jgi:uncharacterized phiE125 gp8 family phage protein